MSGFVRVDWLTIQNEEGDRYRMPYRFQENNTENEGDKNPIYFEIPTDGTDTMKLVI